jgi:hypothetical protein
MNVHVHTEYVDGCTRCELNKDEAVDAAAEFCAHVEPGSFYRSNGDPGDPPEPCDNDALPGSEFCAKHQEEDFWDAADRMYDEARDRRLEMEDNDD